jgi:colanic acid biosynthesis glycosyl transferase WcaI
MRLSIFSYNFAPEPTGIPAYNTSLAHWLVDKLRWEVVVHTGIPHYPWWRPHPDYAGKDFRRGRANEDMGGIEVRRVRHYVPTAPVTGAKRMLLDATWIWSTLWDSIRVRRRPDAILLVSPPFLGALLGIVLRAWWRVPVVYHVQDLQIDAALDLGMIPGWMARLLLRLERVLLRHVDLVTTISEAMRRRLAAKAETRRPIALVPNWADTEAMRPHQGDNAYRREWGFAADELVVLYSGNLGKKQGLEVLIEAFAQLPRQGLRFVIAGEGPERHALEELARGCGLDARIRFVSLAPPERLAELLSAADIHCIPQRRAAADLVLPSKLLNIMAVARPVVATADPDTDLARTIDEAACGLVVEPEDAALLAGAIARLAASAELRQRCGEAARRHVVEHLGIDRILSGLCVRLGELRQERASRGTRQRGVFGRVFTLSGRFRAR